MKISISPIQRKVLECLDEYYDADANCLFFRGIAHDTKLEVRVVRLACRALARKGLTQYVRGLFDDHGMVAGSGYCCTRTGHNLLEEEKAVEKKPLV